MSTPNVPNQSQNDARYATPASVAAAISTQATTDAAQFTAQTKSRLASLLTRFADPNTVPILTTTSATDTPTVTVGTTQTVTGQSYGAHSGILTEVGSRGVWNSTFGRLPVSGLSGLDFWLTGTTVEFCMYPNITGPCALWIWVNGVPVTAAVDSITTTASTTTFVKLVFPSAGRRRIEFFCSHGGSWYQTTTDINTVISPAARKPVVAFVGDSFWSGSNAAGSFSSGAFYISRLLGVEAFNRSYGGTGYILAGSFDTFGSTTRVASVAAANPELIVIQGSINDDAQSGVQAAATAAFAAYAVACPQAKIIVFGPQPSSSTSTISANRANNNAAVKAAAAAAPNVLAFHDMIGTSAGLPAAWASGNTYNEGDLVTRLGSVWKWTNNGAAGNSNFPGTSARWVLMTYALTGTGNTGSVIGDGTRDTMLYSDSVHPMPEAGFAFALRQASLIRSDLLAAI